MHRRFILAAFLISFFTSLCAVKTYAAEALSPEEYPDLPTGWSRDSVINAVNNGLLYGVGGKLLPKEYLTRAQLAAIVNRAFGTSYAADLSLYTDVPAGSWFYDDLSYSVGSQTLVGYQDKLFPNNFATREEVFTVLSRVVEPPQAADLSAIQQFSDFSQISPWAAHGLASMVESGFMHGANGYLQPKTQVTREEFAYVIDQFSDMFITANQASIAPPPSQPSTSGDGSELRNSNSSEEKTEESEALSKKINSHIDDNRALYMDKSPMVYGLSNEIEFSAADVIANSSSDDNANNVLTSGSFSTASGSSVSPEVSE